jgi:hypothetical protein
MTQYLQRPPSGAAFSIREVYFLLSKSRRVRLPVWAVTVLARNRVCIGVCTPTQKNSETSMIKGTLIAASVALSFVAAAPAYAQMGKMECSDAAMKDAKADMMKMSDKGKQETAMKEMKMAEDMMMKKDDKGCAMHMEKAMGAMK